MVGGTQDVGSGLLNNGTAVFIGTTIDGPVTSPAGSQFNVIGNVTFNDLVSGAGGIFGGGTAIFNGGHSPGDSPAIVPVEGNLIYGPANELTIELEGLLEGEFDRLEVMGNAMLDGNLVDDVLPSFTPSFGDTFEIIEVAGTLGGQFIGLGEGAIFSASGGELFRINYGSGNVVLTAVPEPSTLLMLCITGFLVNWRRDLIL